MIGWLPHFHDMGLIGMLLHLLFVRGTLMVAPDFAYDLCARVITPEQAATLDLSSMRWAMNGAEPVRRSTLERFSGRFAVSGFQPSARAVLEPGQVGEIWLSGPSVAAGYWGRPRPPRSTSAPARHRARAPTCGRATSARCSTASST